MDTTTNKKWNKFDTAWVLNLFGTAVGAGVLFLPINAGMGGFWPLVLMAILVGPMTYFAHRGLAYFVLSSSKPGSDITEVVEEHFGPTAGKLITLLYFFAIFPILLIYVFLKLFLFNNFIYCFRFINFYIFSLYQAYDPSYLS